MKRILSSLFVALTLLLVGGAFTTSCSNEILSTQQVDNTPRAFTIKLSAGLGAVQAEELGEIDNPNDTRAGAIDETVKLNFKIIDGTRKMTGDNGFDTNVPQKTGKLNRDLFIAQHPKIKLLTVLRAKNRKSQVYYDYSEWTYDKLSNLYIKDYLSIPLSAGFQLSDEIEVRLALGGRIKVSEDGKTCSIDMYNNLYKQIDLSDAAATQNIEMPIPYISGWEDLRYEESNAQMMLANNEQKVMLNPQGVLFLVTMRNNMNQDLSVKGLRIVSNALDFEGEFHLEGDNVRFEQSFRKAGELNMLYANDQYRTKEFIFSDRLTIEKNPTNNPFNFNHAKVLVIWVMPDGTRGGLDWNTVTGRGQGIKNAQTHVFALDVKDMNNQEITKPNYQIVPIMGTVNTLTPGKSFALNCEFYEQPYQILGHVAKYPVNATGDGFATSHDDDKTDLVNWKVAKDFLKAGKTITMPDGSQAVYKMFDAGFLNLLGLGRYWTNFKGEGKFYDPITTGSVGKEVGFMLSSPGAYNYTHPLHAEGKTTIVSQNSQRTMTFVPRNPQPNGKYVAYRLIGHGIPGASPVNSLVRSPDLSIIKFEVEEGNTAVHQHFTSIYLGKYWVGNLFTPIYNGISITHPEFWKNPILQRNKVERRLPAPGLYDSGSLTAADSDSPYPANPKRYWVGKRAVFWGYADNLNHGGDWMMRQLSKSANLNQFTGEEWIHKMLTEMKISGPFRGMNNAAFMIGQRNNLGWGVDRIDLNRVYLFLPLIVYSDTYQGDSAD